MISSRTSSQPSSGSSAARLVTARCATATTSTRFDDTAAAQALRDEVKQAILMGIQFLRDERDRDPDRGLGARLRGKR